MPKKQLRKLSKIAVSRLTTLIKFMRALPAEADRHFSMSACWAYHRGGEHVHKGLVTLESLLDCGSSACAMGWAASIPEFQKAGLKLRWTEALSVVPAQRVTNDEEDCMKFFDISRGQFWSLFNDNHQETDVTPKAWAKRATTLVKKWSTKGWDDSYYHYE